MTGCSKVSPGCKNCYAQTLAERFRGVPGHPFEHGFDLYLWPSRLSLPLKWKTPRRIFVNSMSDLFHERIPNDYIDAIFRTMADASWHVFQILTKRAERMLEYTSHEGSGGRLRIPPNVWLGVSVESQKYVYRAELLSKIGSTVRFLSCEPLLGPLDLRTVLRPGGVNWVIVGGESGPRARGMDPQWATDIRDQCLDSRVPFFFKQWGGRNKKRAGRRLEDATWDQVPELTPQTG